MHKDPFSQGIAEISERIEILRAQSLGHPDKAAKISAKAFDELQVIMEWLTNLAGGGHDRSGAGCFC